ncbi:UbiA family prenyltransferase [bacterium]|nr:UbiA family prenyltransferase [bacterium]
MKRALLKLLDFVFLMRPLLLIPIWTPFLFGYYRSGGFKSGELVLPFLMITALGGGGFILNQIFDIESDRANRKLFILPRGYVSLNEAWIGVVILDLIAVILGLLHSWEMGLLTTIAVIMGIIYSAPPLALKNRGILALLENGLGHGCIIFLMGWVVTSDLSYTSLILSIPYFFAYSAVYLATTIPDLKGDHQSHKRTLAVLLGSKISGILIILLVLMAFVSGYIAWEIEIVFTAILAFILYLPAIFLGRKWYLLANKTVVLFFMAFAAYLFNFYFIIAIPAIIFTLLYNKFRLGLNPF